MNVSSLEQLAFNLINIARRNAGKTTFYTWSDNLANGARAHSNRMASGCGQQHQCPNEDPLALRILKAWGPATTWHDAENIHHKLPGSG